MPSNLKHFISLEDISRNTFRELLDLAKRLKEERKKNGGVSSISLNGKSLALIFEKPSARTRISFEVGMYQLGGTVVFMQPSDIKMGEREPIPDVARVISRYVDTVLLRTFSHQTIKLFSQHSSVPIINGLSDTHHPCQALSDILTIEEKLGSAKDKKIVYIGDGNNVCRSLINACAHVDAKVTVSTPKGYELSSSGLIGDFTYEPNPQKAAIEANVIYTDVWTSMGQEKEATERVVKFKPFQINSQLLKAAQPDCLFMHCLPAHRGEEVTEEVLESKQSVVFDQAENRMHAQKAVLVSLMT